MARRMNPWVGWALALTVAAGFSSLGVWQYGREQEKRLKLDEAAQVLDRRETKPLSAAGDATRMNAYDWAAGVGEFADAPAVLLDNQQRDGRVGVRAYRLFVPSGATPLLVELGWLPLPGDRDMPHIERPTGMQQVHGLLAPPPSAGIIEPAAQSEGENAWLVTSMDAGAMRALLRQPDLPPRVLRLDPAMNDIGYARDLDILPNTIPPERHLAYAVQWFGLALTVLVVAAVLTFRQRKSGRAKMTA